jgi:hypothetical protein
MYIPKPGIIGGNHFTKVFSVMLPHCSESIQVIKNDTLVRTLYFVER